MENILYQIVSGLLISVVTSWITVRLSLKRFRSERMWERKVQAYEKIFESLHHLKAYCVAHLRAEESGSKLDDYRKEERYAKFKIALEEINKYKDIGSFLMAVSAVERLNSFEKELDKSYEGKTIYEIADNQYGCVTSCIKDIDKIARADIKN